MCVHVFPGKGDKLPDVRLDRTPLHMKLGVLGEASRARKVR